MGVWEGFPGPHRLLVQSQKQFRGLGFRGLGVRVREILNPQIRILIRRVGEGRMLRDEHASSMFQGVLPWTPKVVPLGLGTL